MKKIISLSIMAANAILFFLEFRDRHSKTISLLFALVFGFLPYLLIKAEWGIPAHFGGRYGGMWVDETPKGVIRFAGWIIILGTLTFMLIYHAR